MAHPFSELARALTLTARILRAKPLVLLGAMVTYLALPGCACIVGAGIVCAAGAVTLAAARTVVAPKPHDRPRVTSILAYGLVPLASLVANAAARDWAAGPEAAATTLGVAGAGALFGLVAGLPFHALGGAPLGVALERALTDAVAAGLVRRGIAGAVIAIVAHVPLFVAVGIRPDSPVGIVVTGCFSGGLGIVASFALGVSDEAAPAPPARSARGALAGVLALGVPVVLVFFAALVWASVRSSGAHGAPTDDELTRSERLVDSRDLAGPEGVVVSRTSTGVRVETADGGGAGDVDLGAWRLADTVEVRVASDAAGFVVIASGVPDRSPFGPEVGGVLARRAVSFDHRGVRTDDGITDRIAVHFGSLGMTALALAFLLLLPFTARLARGLRDAAVLDRDAAGGAWRAWRGTIDVDAGGALRLAAGRLVVDGHARLVRDRSDGVVTLASDALVLGDAPPEAGSIAAVVARADRLAELGPRSGALPWPTGAWLVVGGLDAARDRITRDALAASARFGVPAALLVLVACALSIL